MSWFGHDTSVFLALIGYLGTLVLAVFLFGLAWVAVEALWEARQLKAAVRRAKKALK